MGTYKLNYSLLASSSVRKLWITGSVSRETNRRYSDLDIVVKGSPSDARKAISSELHVDIYDENELPRCPINPKLLTIRLDQKLIYGSSQQASLSVPEKVKELFIYFLEFERWKNYLLLKEKSDTFDARKKLPGGRRSLDELIWLEKLGLVPEEAISQAEEAFEYPKNKIQHQLMSNISKLDVLYLRHVKPFIGSTSKRGLELMRSIRKDLTIKFESSDEKLTAPPTCCNMIQWLQRYLAAFQQNLGRDQAFRLASLETDAYESQKNLLQNVWIRHKPWFGDLLEVLESSPYRVVRRYAKMLSSKHPNYLSSLEQQQRDYLLKNTHHIRNIGCEAQHPKEAPTPPTKHKSKAQGSQEISVSRNEDAVGESAPRCSARSKLG